jgi:hypothetical protein
MPIPLAPAFNPHTIRSYLWKKGKKNEDIRMFSVGGGQWEEWGGGPNNVYTFK